MLFKRGFKEGRQGSKVNSEDLLTAAEKAGEGCHRQRLVLTKKGSINSRSRSCCIALCVCLTAD